MAVITAAIFRFIFTVIENRRPPGEPHRNSRPSHPHHDRPGGKRGGAAGRVRGQLRLPRFSSPCRFGTMGNSVGEAPGRVQIARFWCGRLARL